MKKLKKITIMIIVVLATLTIKSNAETFNISMGGEEKAKAGETKSASIIMNSTDKEVSSVSGIIGVENIDKDSIKIEGTEGWKLTYNKETGNFIIYNEVGAKSGTIMNVTYTISSNATNSAKITIKDTNITTTDYEETKIGERSKIIIVENSKSKTDNEVEKTTNTKEKATPQKIPHTGISLFPILGSIVIVSIISIISYRKSKAY